jgi:hypothetical protein
LLYGSTAAETGGLSTLKLDQIDTSRALAGRLDLPPRPECAARLPDGFGRRFLIVGDAEEEFDWGAPLNRGSTSTEAFTRLPEANRRFSERGVVPTYVVDYPVVANPRSAAALAEMHGAGACDTGTHLHPWVSPPHVEEVNGFNSFAGNLPAELEEQKLAMLTDRIAELVGSRPIVYRAGRYGIGPHSAAILRALGYRLDLSVRARFDYSGEGGPDFTHYPVHPYWVSEDLLEVPLTTCLAGPLGRWPALARSSRLRGPFARSGLLNRIPLTPEGVPVSEAKDAIERLLDSGQRLFSLSFHTPTVVPGHTPYVRDAAGLDLFWRWWDEVFDLFARHGVLPTRPAELVEAAGAC